MDYSTIAQTLAQVGHSSQTDALPLSEVLEQVRDGRKKRGVRYRVALILTLIVLAKLAGETSLSGVAQWVCERREYLARALQLPSTRFACVATYSYVLQHVDAEQVTSVIQQFFTQHEAKQRCGSEPSQLLNQNGRKEHAHHAHVALDGKTDAEERCIMKQPSKDLCICFLCMRHAPGSCWLSIRCARKRMRSVLSKPGCRPARCKIALSGLMPCIPNVSSVRCSGASTVTPYLSESANQPQLYEDLQLFFEDPEADRSGWQSSRRCNKGHGRLEIREITTSTDRNSFFERDWQDIAQVFRLQRTLTRKGKTSQEVVYGLTSLPPKQADSPRLMHLNRAHWQIENRLHWRRDVTLGEDRCQVRKGQAPQVLAALNNAVLALADALHISNLAAQMRVFDAHPEQALAILLGPDF